MPNGRAEDGGAGDGPQALGIAVAGLLGQVGCVTVAIIAVALLAGLWLDTQLDTRPLFTILLILGSVPVTLYLMVRLVLSGMSRIQPTTTTSQERSEEDEEAHVGRTT